MENSRDGLPIRHFARPEEWAEWLAVHHADSAGLWLQLAKKASGIPSITYAQAVEVALCYGWIDSLKKSYDDNSWLQKFSPRKAQSKWSKINREKAEQLIAGGQMQPAGLAAIEAAKADGRWEAAYDAPSTATVPPDLQEALDQNPAAASFFTTLNATNRYAILHRIQTAKKAETRARRIQQFVEMLARNEKLYP
jgi:uncharacterized protein YdeI (YjbR/CyaY-like superfamily)